MDTTPTEGAKSRKARAPKTPTEPAQPSQEPRNGHHAPNGHDEAVFDPAALAALKAKLQATARAPSWEQHNDKLGKHVPEWRERNNQRIEAARRRRAQPRWPKPFRGPMRDAVNATLAASNRPRPCVAMGAVLAGMASAISGLDCLDDGMRLNLFVSVAVDPSGGKDIPRLAAQAIAAAAGVAHEGAPASGAALERMLAHYMPMLLPIDESARMQGAQKDKGAQHYSKDLIDVLLKLFSASRSSYSTRAYADSKKGDTRRLIWHPCINLLMFATDFGVARSLDSGSIKTGELPRQLFIHDSEPVKHRRAPEFVLPPSVKEIAAQCKLIDTEKAALGEDGGGEKPAMHRKVAETAQAKRLLDLVMARHDGKDAYRGDAPLGVMLASRHYEKVFRVAGVLAKWDNPNAPEMTGRHVAWAERFVTACDIAMANYYASEVHDSAQSADVAAVRRAMQDALDGKGGRRIGGNAAAIKEGIVPRPLVQYLAQSMPKRRFDDAVATLEALEEIETASARLGQRTGTVLLRGAAWEQR